MAIAETSVIQEIGSTPSLQTTEPVLSAWFPQWLERDFFALQVGILCYKAVHLS